ncbi:hypothetical protein [Enterobacter hormaechei]|uniref:hypothetical protein n=1 Tax=Enterobacter hormaechei TaxID=158836 RepID=UPI002175F237|nr:hypothetical protein [Enterobacter hormaechei]UVZ93281.1 hypothetical protein M5T14_22295 [Enterobacter hormaechei]
MFQSYKKMIMKKNIIKISFTVISAMLLLGVVVFASTSIQNKNMITINQCRAVIDERSEYNGIKSKFERVISIAGGKGYAKDTGIFYEKEREWRLNRFYSFSLIPLSKNRYQITVLSQDKLYDDNVPDNLLRKLRPGQVKVTNVTIVENIGTNVWLFSSIAFPIFACKERKKTQ